VKKCAKGRRTVDLEAGSGSEWERHLFTPKRPLGCEKAILCGPFRFFARRVYLAIERGRKLCKFAKKVIAPYGFDDYYKRFGCKD
jgi:hypothetical protein